MFQKGWTIKIRKNVKEKKKNIDLLFIHTQPQKNFNVNSGGFTDSDAQKEREVNHMLSSKP